MIRKLQKMAIQSRAQANNDVNKGQRVIQKRISNTTNEKGDVIGTTTGKPRVVRNKNKNKDILTQIYFKDAVSGKKNREITKHVRTENPKQIDTRAAMRGEIVQKKYYTDR